MNPNFKLATPGHINSRLFQWAGVFLFLYSLILTLSPAVRERSWNVEYRWSHWLGFAVWLLIFSLAHFLSRRWLPDADPYIIPLAALLTGWGILTIFRLNPGFGIRQTCWLLISGIIILIGMRFSPELGFLRRYKYIWLTSGLIITGLTLLFGTSPSGGEEHAWLGCCGIYFQPSEPLKLLLLIYLAAYLADHFSPAIRPFPLLAPTAVVISVALLLLIFQRDLGTVSIFIFLYTIILFVASGKMRIIIFSLAGLVLAGIAGYFFFDLIRIRIDAWINPWLDPSGRSFQIVQSLMAVANGGVFGRGPGLGSPGLVPVAISDFVFTSIAEETGLIGTLGLLGLIGLFASRGIGIALRAPDNFRRILAAGLTAYLGTQSILIIGGNIRLLPLTGVTLPFVSYGGSSLLTSFLALLILLLISSQPDKEPASIPKPRPYFILAGLIGFGLLALAALNTWWAVWRSPDILNRTDNARRSISDRYVKRGSLFDRHETPINISIGKPGDYLRVYLYPRLAPVTGYTNPNYGQSGLETSLDEYLRGLQGNPVNTIWWDYLVYGQPPPGLNIRLSLDMELQQQADELLGNSMGAIILINATSGEILVMASHPAFDPNVLESQVSTLLKDPNSPMLDRAGQGTYIPGEALQPFFHAAGYRTIPSFEIAGNLLSALGFYTAPELRLPVAPISTPGGTLRLSPLQMALAAASLSNHGVKPTPRLAMAVEIPNQGWSIIPALGEPLSVFPSGAAEATAKSLMISSGPFWQWTSWVTDSNHNFFWSVGGTLPDWQGVPLSVVVLLEEDNPGKAGFIGQSLLESAAYR
jgi:cell division protein FtsW (lipid II flippase)